MITRRFLDETANDDESGLTHMMSRDLPDTLEILEGWDLLASAAAVERLSVGDLRTIGEVIDRYYAAAPIPDIGGCHIGLSDSIRIMEGRAPLTQLAFQLVTHDHLWLPDPIYSFLSLKGSKLWHQTPEGGGKLFGDAPSFTIPWRSLWDYPKEGRRNHAQRTLPGLIAVMRDLRPLIRSRYVRPFAWEQIAFARLESVRDSVLVLEKTLLRLRSTALFRRANTRSARGLGR